MKKYIYLFFVALFATTSFAFTSCGDDDESNDSNSGNIIGTWEQNVNIDDDWQSIQLIQFKQDGTFVEVYDSKFMGGNEVEISRGTWRKDGNNLTVVYDNDKETDLNHCTIVKLTDKELIVESFAIGVGVKVKLTKVADSKIEAYL